MPSSSTLLFRVGGTLKETEAYLEQLPGIRTAQVVGAPVG